jgi:AraC family transcriptional regulator
MSFFNRAVLYAEHTMVKNRRVSEQVDQRVLSGRVTYGQAIRQVSTPTVVVTETRHAAWLTLKRHDHESANVNLVLSGRFSETVERHAYECRENTALLKPGGSQHSDRYGRTSAHCLVVEFTDAFATGYPEAAPLLEEHTQCGTPAIAVVAQQLYSQLSVSDVSTTLIVDGLSLQLLGLMRRAKTSDEGRARPPAWALRTRDLIEADHSAALRLTTLSELAGVPATHLNRTFKRYFGATVGAYSRDTRLRAALRLLSEGTESLASVAAATGFWDQSHFTAAFKRRFGVTPAAFRRARRT